ncbi:MAG: hypothetical protein KDD40_10085, partial [Bdellovibrionales bacterium]|nr:hypothetical protein [Bdellovibrionales bacterium]
KINLSGLVVSESDQRNIENLIQILIDKSPSNSYLNLCIISGESEVNGFLSITSKSQKFESSQYGDNPLDVVKKLSIDLLAQIKIWISERVF